MSEITQLLKLLPDPQKSLGEILVQYYDTMKMLERCKDRGGKQATKIVMTMNDIENLYKNGTKI